PTIVAALPHNAEPVALHRHEVGVCRRSCIHKRMLWPCPPSIATHADRQVASFSLISWVAEQEHMLFPVLVVDHASLAHWIDQILGHKHRVPPRAAVLADRDNARPRRSALVAAVHHYGAVRSLCRRTFVASRPRQRGTQLPRRAMIVAVEVMRCIRVPRR